MIVRRKSWERLNQMLDEGIRGEFTESRYDETELSKLEAKWKQFLDASVIARGNLEQEKENIKGMISDISHQTKTPVANIRLYGELLRESLEKSGAEPGQREMAAQICRQAEKLEFLIQSLTKMSRLESDIVAVHPKSQSIRKLVERAVEEVRPRAEKKEISLDVECREDFLAEYDEKWTAEALFNVLDNAVKYSPAHSCVRIAVKARELYGCIEVSDQGPGISEEDTPRIFQRFYRADSVDQEEGVGIGLYLAREILRKENGYIRVRSKPGSGSTFGLYLPISSQFFQKR